ncbi:entericidin B [Nitrosomonas cryotolerans]|uniref:Entericidin B n=1 Tax=Nitrosomonas cryotolerans ATCC 49181 TaxID=1131553 RepID=A0A1N6IFF1_9PROT|nr:entericidin A/B family lipoprotein [Nitrosomonas cryotolerans]SFP80972.1 entericidin B [Nitrosomonas cryotolerans]SIO30711.1 entericidin B [Nitrosomonas cryotolerans ATCC 49181]
MMRILSLIVTIVTVSYLSACNTMAGLGKDVQKGGKAIERSAE